MNLPEGGKTLTKDQHDEKLRNQLWESLNKTHVVDPRRPRPDLMTWRRGSAQLTIKINPQLGNLSIYSVLVSGVTPTEGLFRYLLSYNLLQRRESLGMAEKGDKVYIVLKPGATASEEEIIAFCRENLAPYKVPRFVEFRDELPKTLVGKVLRRALVEEELKKRARD